ncbi:MAG: hypothetical protein K0S71_1150 [Clostridia bacterium]|jgi:hypothetical protein|nr:hypothetical protein [Clostridia bacterium]
MKSILKFKVLVSIILSIVIMSAYIPSSAASPGTTPSVTPSPPPSVTPSVINHKETIEQFIFEIREIQNQTFNIAQLALSNPPLFAQRLASNITYINSRIDSLNTRILEYLESIPTIGNQNTHVLLTLNALNFIKNGLYTLSVLTQTTPNVQRIQLLDQYFRSRIAGIDTLTTVENLLLQN